MLNRVKLGVSNTQWSTSIGKCNLKDRFKVEWTERRKVFLEFLVKQSDKRWLVLKKDLKENRESLETKCVIRRIGNEGN